MTASGPGMTTSDPGLPVAPSSTPGHAIGPEPSSQLGADREALPEPHLHLSSRSVEEAARDLRPCALSHSYPSGLWGRPASIALAASKPRQRLGRSTTRA